LTQVGITAIGCWAFIALSRSADAGLILIYPFFLGIPGAIVTLAVFVPVEAAGVRRRARWISLLLIPLVGAAVPWFLFPLAGNLHNFVEGTVQLSWIGLVWGFLWVVTRPAYALLNVGSGTNTGYGTLIRRLAGVQDTLSAFKNSYERRDR
jgi:hypothetical protein